MCSGSTWKPSNTSFIMGGEFKKQDSLQHHFNFSWIIGLWWFNWFQKWWGKRMSWYWWAKLVVWEENWVQRWLDLQRRQPSWVMTIIMFGSKGVLSYILETSCIDVNKACGLDWLSHYILLLMWTLLFQLRLLSSCLMLLHFNMSCCILLTMYGTPCSFYSCCFFAL